MTRQLYAVSTMVRGASRQICAIGKRIISIAACNHWGALGLQDNIFYRAEGYDG